jgi:hypothetical protein
MVLARSAAPFSASIADCLRYVYCFDGICLVLSLAWWAYVKCVFSTFLQHIFACGGNILSVWRWLKKRRKFRSTIKTAASQTVTWAPRIYAIVKILLGFCPPADEVIGLLASSGLGPWRWNTVPRWRVVSLFCLCCFQCLLQSSEVEATS